MGHPKSAPTLRAEKKTTSAMAQYHWLDGGPYLFCNIVFYYNYHSYEILEWFCKDLFAYFVSTQLRWVYKKEQNEKKVLEKQIQYFTEMII